MLGPRGKNLLERFPFFGQDLVTEKELGPWIILEPMIKARRVYHREIIGQQDARLAL